MSIIKDIKLWLCALPALKGRTVHVDFTDSRGESLSISPIGDTTLESDFSGVCTAEFSFFLRLRLAASNDHERAAGIATLEALSREIETSVHEGGLLLSLGRAIFCECGEGALEKADSSGVSGLYRLKCRLIYEREGGAPGSSFVTLLKTEYSPPLWRPISRGITERRQSAVSSTDAFYRIDGSEFFPTMLQSSQSSFLGYRCVGDPAQDALFSKGRFSDTAGEFEFIEYDSAAPGDGVTVNAVFGTAAANITDFGSAESLGRSGIAFTLSWLSSPIRGAAVYDALSGKCLFTPESELGGGGKLCRL